MTTLYLTRHGETFDNVAQIMQGQTEGKLNDNGKAQAEELARQLCDVHIDAVVASDLRRAIETARIVARPHGLPVETTPLLRERDWGGFTGRFIPSLKGEPWPDDVETLERLLARAKAFLDYIRARHDGTTVVAVGHGIINKAIQAVHYKKTMPEIARMANAELRKLVLE